MNKSEFISALATKSGLSKTDATNVVDALVEVVAEEVHQKGDSINIPGLGIFKQKKVPARTGRNPSTGAAIQIEAKTKLTFSPSGSLKK